MPLTVSLGEHLPPLVLDTPFWALLAIVLPLVVGWLRRQRAVQRERRLARYAEATALARLVPMREDGERRRTWRLITAAALIGLAMAGPRWGLARGPVSSRGIDMAIALDASLSMMAPDEKPNRLERMKQEVRRLRAMSQADRVALIAFAGRSYILTPLTSDDGALELFLENLDPSVVGQAGSSIAKAMRQGTELLLASDGSADRALVVMTDGESFDPVEDVETAAREAGAKGVSVVTVGFGTARGSTIPVRDGSSVTVKTDEEGNVVVTRYSPELLEKAATAASGTFIPADASDKATRIRGALRALRTARRSVDTREDHVPRFLWLLVPALLLLVYDSWRLVAPAATAAAPAMLSWLLVLVPTVFLGCAAEPDPAALFKEGRVADAIAAYRAMVAQGDTSARTVYNLGTAILGADSLQEAQAMLEAVRKNSEGDVRARARFNAGLAALKQGRMADSPDADQQLASARDAYRAYLMERPGYADAKWNYELALRKQPPQSGGGGGGGGGGNNRNDDPPQPQSQGGLDQRQADALLNSAAREEKDVQGRKQRQGRVPRGGKDW
ncbi:VWA domain-containing protein [Gemmatimonas sp.]|uniref:vWA domain-containing protein n=1 Tax=Gemmatimonas sp. TaxID=1962908 RepID=UPI0027B9132E|nr:VWA domain-containing protein [Gemmatimonas sp.]